MSDQTCVACSDGQVQLEQQSCPECGSIKYEEAEGCTLCMECGYSPCS